MSLPATVSGAGNRSDPLGRLDRRRDPGFTLRSVTTERPSILCSGSPGEPKSRKASMSTQRTRLAAAVRIALPLALLAAIIAGGASTLRSSTTGPSYEDLALLTNVLHLVRQNYVKDVDEHQLVEGALKGMLDTLDPHTSYLSKDLYKEVQRDTKGEFEGLGIEISKGDGGDKAEGFVTVVSPIDGTPAALAGIKAKDQIVAVCPDGTDKTCKST